MQREERGISAAELEVMRVLWSAGKPLNITDIRLGLEGTGWEASTIKTLVARLVKKGELKQEKREDLCAGCAAEQRRRSPNMRSSDRH